MSAHTAEIDAPLAALIAEHASHGFSGVMRGPSDGCPVYVAAVALDDALRATCVTPPGLTERQAALADAVAAIRNMRNDTLRPEQVRADAIRAVEALS